MYCSSCGIENQEEASFCSSCGNPLNGSPSEHPAQPKASIASSAQTQSLYEAAIGPKNTDYYLTVFERFDTAGPGVSWNWPSFFVTFYWFLYRKMWGWAVLYYVVPFFIGMTFGGVSTLLQLAYLGVIFLIFPMYANALYYRHLKKKIQRVTTTINDEQEILQALAAKGGTSNIVVIIIGVLVVIFFVGVLAAISLPLYQDYIVRSKMSEAMVALAEAKTSVTEYVASAGGLPGDGAGAEFGVNIAERNGDILKNIIVLVASPEVYITANVNEAVWGDGTGTAAFSLVGTVAADSTIQWQCNPGGPMVTAVDAKYLPANCRGEFVYSN